MMTELIINEFLCFVAVQTGKLDRQNIETLLNESYHKDDALFAKHLLITECVKAGLNNAIDNFKKPRKSPNILQKVVKDILDIWDVVDRENNFSVNLSPPILTVSHLWT